MARLLIEEPPCAVVCRAEQVSVLNLTDRDGWIFDMDGTLTVAVHDFEAIRASLGLAPGLPILEQLEAMPEQERLPLFERLDSIEMEIARRAVPQDGARELLASLADRGVMLGILTRNSNANAAETLAAAGLDGYFDADCIVGRESARPKPSPDGVLHLLEVWRCRPERAVMVGDFLFDLLAGREAGTATVYLDTPGQRQWSEYADVTVNSLSALRRHAFDTSHSDGDQP